MINYQIFLCYKLIFNFNNYFYNFGFYVGFSILIMIIILLFVYFCKGKNSIKIQYLHNEPKMNEIKNLEKDFNNIYKNNKDKSNIEVNNESQKIIMK